MFKKSFLLRTLLLFAFFSTNLQITPSYALGGEKKKTSWFGGFFSKEKSLREKQANFGIRGLVLLIEWTLVGLVTLTSNLVVNRIPQLDGRKREALSNLVFIISVLYLVTTDIIKHSLSLETVDKEGKRAEKEKLVVRALLKYFLFWIDWIGLFTDDERLLHDQITNTYVIVVPKA